MHKIKIKYFDKEIDKIEKIKIGNWIDLRSSENISYKAGDFIKISLGVGMKLPEGYEVNIVPRGSTFKNYGVIQTNSFGVVDNSYSGNGDCYFFVGYALRDGTINKNDRICQFRLNKVMEDIEFEEVEYLDEVDRGGHGSTGKQ